MAGLHTRLCGTFLCAGIQGAYNRVGASFPAIGCHPSTSSILSPRIVPKEVSACLFCQSIISTTSPNPEILPNNLVLSLTVSLIHQYLVAVCTLNCEWKKLPFPYHINTAIKSVCKVTNHSKIA